MIGIGIVLLFVLYNIFRSENELLRGAMMPLGFILLSLSAYIMDYGFVSRSDAFLVFLDKL